MLRNPCQNICVLVLVNGPSSHTSSSFHQSNTRAPLKVLFRASSKRVHTHHHFYVAFEQINIPQNVASLSLSTLLFPLFPELQTGDRTESGEARCPVTVRPEPEPRTQTQQHWSQSVGPLARGRTPAPATHLVTTTAQLQLDIWSWAWNIFPLAVYWI